MPFEGTFIRKNLTTGFTRICPTQMGGRMSTQPGHVLERFVADVTLVQRQHGIVTVTAVDVMP